MIELIVCTAIWGASFVAQKLGAEHFGPFAINCWRNLLAALVLYAAVRIRARRGADAGRGWTRRELVGGALSGECLFGAMVAQQLGLERTGPGVSAFLTANYVLFVPVFAAALGRRARWPVWAGVALSLLGSSLICLADFSAADLRLGTGEAWTLLCAVIFAVQILVVDRFAGGCDMFRFSAVQMLVAGLVALPFVFLPSEQARCSWSGFLRGLPSVLWLGVLSSGVAYTLQNLGQVKVRAALASIIMSLEGAFAALFGWLLLDDVLTPRQALGCGCILLAVLVSQARAETDK